jgi:hypothetical protein
MKLKTKSQMTNRELCDIEGLIFPIIAEADGSVSNQKKAFIDLITTSGEELVKLCYTSDNGSKLEEVNEKYRFTLMQDFPIIMSFVFEEISETPTEGKPQPQRIKKR